MLPVTSRQTSQELQELVSFVGTLALTPEETAKMTGILDRLDRRIERRNASVMFVKSALTEISFDAKCVIHDLEATRRERDSYRRQLENLRGESDLSSDD